MKRDGIEKKRRSRGFTLTELLSVLAILAILTALAVPAVGLIRSRLRMRRLDDTARQIYIAAQNRMIVMKATGELLSFKADIKTTAQMLTDKPAGYSADDFNKFYYLSSADTGTKTLMQDYFLTDRSVLVTCLSGGSCYMLELNPESGDVYSVFYADTAFSRDDVKSLDSADADSGRERDARESFGKESGTYLGYYCGGGDQSAAAQLPAEFTITPEIVNSEDLYATFLFPDIRGELFTHRERLTLTVTLADQHEHQAARIIRGTDRDFTVFGSGTGVAAVLMDSLNESNSYPGFKFGGAEQKPSELTGTACNLTPGDDLTVTATLTYERDGAVLITGTASDTVNDCFQSRSDSEDGKTAKIGVSTVRHLNNLRKFKAAAGNSGIQTVEISQTSDIDFKWQDWAKNARMASAMGEGEAMNPLTSFQPIVTDTAFRYSFDGQNSCIRNFPIAGAAGQSGVGLFASYPGDMKNMRMEDCSAAGTSKVGMLAGMIRGGTAENCGVYLSTASYDDMKDRVERCTVTASGSDAGALFGTAEDTTLLHCCGAVNTSGTSAVGGLVGSGSAVIVDGCYSSGTVTASGAYAGGLAGLISGSGNRITDSYVTSDVTGTSAVGGMAGGATGLSAGADRFYGQAVNASGGTLEGGFGPVSGSGTYSLRGTVKNIYLSQGTSYNGFLTTDSNATARNYEALDRGAATPENSHPYDSSLYTKAFPFPLIQWTSDGTEQRLEHYGNWPAQFRLQTTLAYYEKYLDAAGKPYYGYYAVTSLVSGSGGTSSDEVNQWTVDTLERGAGISCVEDGYALLSPFDLASYEYRLNYDKDSTVPYTTVSQTDPLTSNVALEFSKKDSSGETIARYTVSRAYAFRLPFGLQMTDRISAARFYDQLQIAKAMANDRDTLEGKTYTFYYCPDFAQNAINPDMSANATTAGCPADPSGEANPIYVRSARQLNAMGRASYYWNPTNNQSTNTDKTFYFKQTLDIDFGKYTRTYCGMTFNLMDTSSGNLYRNRPIGRPNGQSFTINGKDYTPAQFKNRYDGGGYRIIDYCCTTYLRDNYQFTGLFGEVYTTTLKNIVLVASDPDNASGCVESYYVDSGEAKNPGVGALAGLLYVDGASKTASSCSVENCAVSGYTVLYHADISGRRDAAVGGMVGYSMGSVRNSSAMCKTIGAVMGSGTESKIQKNIYISGLVGGLARNGTIANSYAGAELSGGNAGGYTAYYYSGLAGFDSVKNVWSDSTGSSDSRTVTNSYAMSKLATGAKSGTVYPVSPISGLTVSGCRYLKRILSDVALSDSSVSGRVTGLSERQLGALTNLDGFGRASAEHTYPNSAVLKGQAYQYPAVVRAGGDFVHYGDWPYYRTDFHSVYAAYYERYSDGTYGYQTVDELSGQQTVISTLDTANQKTISAAGYGLLCLDDGPDFTVTAGGTAYTQDSARTGSALTAADLTGQSYSLYAMSTSLTARLQSAKTDGFCKLTLQEDTGSRGVYVAPDYVSVTRGQSGDALPGSVQVRTANQLASMLAGQNQGQIAEFRQTHNIDAAGLTAGAGTWNRTFNGCGNTISGLCQPLTAVNSGTLKNVRLVRVNLALTASTSAAPLTQSNQGTVTNCCAEGSVKGTSAAGLIGANSGTLKNSYANCTVTATSGSAAGLVLTNSTDGTVENCYASGSVSGSTAAGLTAALGKRVVSCYASVKVSGTSAYGFAPSANGVGTVTNCFWLKDTGINKTLAGGDSRVTAVNVKTLSAASTITALNGGTSPAPWAADTDGTHTDRFGTTNKIYPYPYLAWTPEDDCNADGGMHYGGWPVNRSGRFGAAVLYDRWSGGWNGSWKGQYTVSGCSVDADGANLQTYSPSNSSRSINLIAFDQNFYNTCLTSGWTVSYLDRWGDAHAISVTSASSEYTLQGGQAPGMIFQKINSYYTPYTVVFSDGITNYTFDYSYYDSTFTYAGASAVTD